MKYEEKQMNLFDVDLDKYHLAHCISSDFALGAGIALDFQSIFGMRDTLNGPAYEPYAGKYPYVIRVDRVFNLVTKKNCWDKPSYKHLYDTLVSMRDFCIRREISYIAMPKIGCGIDGLDWNAVLVLIQSVFEQTDIEILVCYL